MRCVVAAVFGLLFLSPALACEDGHWLQENLADGKILELEDGTLWKVAAFDAITTQLWLPTDEILVCDDKLIHVDDGEAVSVVEVPR